MSSPTLRLSLPPAPSEFLFPDAPDGHQGSELGTAQILIILFTTGIPFLLLTCGFSWCCLDRDGMHRRMKGTKPMQMLSRVRGGRGEKSLDSTYFSKPEASGWFNWMYKHFQPSQEATPSKSNLEPPPAIVITVYDKPHDPEGRVVTVAAPEPVAPGTSKQLEHSPHPTASSTARLHALVSMQSVTKHAQAPGMESAAMHASWPPSGPAHAKLASKTSALHASVDESFRRLQRASGEGSSSQARLARTGSQPCPCTPVSATSSSGYVGHLLQTGSSRNPITPVKPATEQLSQISSPTATRAALRTTSNEGDTPMSKASRRSASAGPFRSRSKRSDAALVPIPPPILSGVDEEVGGSWSYRPQATGNSDLTPIVGRSGFQSHGVTRSGTFSLSSGRRHWGFSTDDADSYHGGSSPRGSLTRPPRVGVQDQASGHTHSFVPACTRLVRRSRGGTDMTVDAAMLGQLPMRPSDIVSAWLDTHMEADVEVQGPIEPPPEEREPEAQPRPLRTLPAAVDAKAKARLEASQRVRSQHRAARHTAVRQSGTSSVVSAVAAAAAVQPAGGSAAKHATAKKSAKESAKEPAKKLAKDLAKQSAEQPAEHLGESSAFHQDSGRATSTNAGSVNRSGSRGKKREPAPGGRSTHASASSSLFQYRHQGVGKEQQAEWDSSSAFQKGIARFLSSRNNTGQQPTTADRQCSPTRVATSAATELANFAAAATQKPADSKQHNSSAQREEPQSGGTRQQAVGVKQPSHANQSAGSTQTTTMQSDSQTGGHHEALDSSSPSKLSSGVQFSELTTSSSKVDSCQQLGASPASLRRAIVAAMVPLCAQMVAAAERSAQNDPASDMAGLEHMDHVQQEGHVDQAQVVDATPTVEQVEDVVHVGQVAENVGKAGSPLAMRAHQVHSHQLSHNSSDVGSEKAPSPFPLKDTANHPIGSPMHAPKVLTIPDARPPLTSSTSQNARASEHESLTGSPGKVSDSPASGKVSGKVCNSPASGSGEVALKASLGLHSSGSPAFRVQGNTALCTSGSPALCASGSPALKRSSSSNRFRSSSPNAHALRGSGDRSVSSLHSPASKGSASPRRQVPNVLLDSGSSASNDENAPPLAVPVVVAVPLQLLESRVSPNTPAPAQQVTTAL